ncbi:MAG: hypothetical protein WC683_08175 [bacterium]
MGKYLSWQELFAANGVMPTANDAQRMVRYAKGKALIYKRVGMRRDRSEYERAVAELDKYLGV